MSDQLKAQFYNLPAQLTSLIGREREIQVVCSLLRQPEVRLVTLTGPGGVGKTRLALQVAADLLDEFADGICFVPLAPISDPDLVPSTIAQMLGLKEPGDQSLLDLLKALLQDKCLLLLLDNFEQVLAAVPWLADLLAACPSLKVMVTSRAVLHIRGEHEFPVPSLALPDFTHLPESEALSQYAAVALFLERALAAGGSLPDPRVDPSVRAKALMAAANLAFVQSDYEQTEVLCKESLALYRELGDHYGIAFSLYRLGNVAWVRGNTAEARSLTEEALAIFKEVDHREYVAYSLFSLALVASSQGEYARACTLYEGSVAIHRELENKRGIAHSLSQLAQALFDSQADHARVRSLVEECLTLSREVGFKEGIAAAQCLSGQLALSQSDLATAHAEVEQSVLLYKEMGHRHGLAESLAVLGKVLAAEGDYAAAQALYEESLAISGELGEKWMIARGLVGLGEVVAAEHKLAWAAQLWGAADALRDAIGVPIPPVELTEYERSLAATRVHLGERAFAAAWAKGRAITPRQALAAQGQKPTPPPSSTVTPSPIYPAGLTAREVEVLRLLAGGLTDLQIAEQLVLSPRTVHAHISSIYSKLAVTSRSAATRYAIEHYLG